MGDSYLTSKSALDIPYITFPDLLRKRAEQFPNKTAYIFFDENDQRSLISFGELYDKATKFAKALVQYGIQRGDIVGLNGRNLPEWLIANFGIQMSGGYTLCLPYQQKRTDFIEVCSKIGNMRMLIIDPGLDGENCQIIQDMMRTDIGISKAESSEVPDLKDVILFNHHDCLPSVYTVAELYSRECEVDLPRLDPEDLGLILLSSGSTNTPKAIPFSHYSMVIISHHFLQVFQTTNNNEESFYNDRPFFWSAGYPAWEIASGGSRVTRTNAMQSSSMAAAAEYACEIISRERTTTAMLIPSLLDLVMKRNMPLKIKKIATGSMIINSSLLECIGKVCDELITLYGITEHGIIACRTYTGSDTSNARKGLLSYRPVSGVEIKTTDDDCYLLPVRQRGAIQVRSIRRFNGYLNQNVSPISNETLTKTGWFCTGDGGYITEDGALIVEGRLQEVIQVFGRKVFPFEIENVIKSKGNVLSAIVMPLKEKETGDLPPCAAIVYRPPNEDSQDVMQEYIRKKFNITTENQLLEYLYVPQVIVSFKEFPVLANGKPNRLAIRQIVLETVNSEKYDGNYRY